MDSAVDGVWISSDVQNTLDTAQKKPVDGMILSKTTLLKKMQSYSSEFHSRV